MVGECDIRLLGGRQNVRRALIGLLACGAFWALPGSASASPALTFAPATNYGAHNLPTGDAIGDLNGDGKPDLVVANSGASNDVSVLLGSGSGSFRAAANYAAHSTPVAVAIGDVNGDGKPDLVVANSGSTDVSVLLGTGSGSFAPAANYAADGNPSSVAIGDLNGDGKPDLVVADGGANDVSVLLGTGTGSFGAATNFNADTAGASPASVAIGDLNGDGIPDLAVADSATDHVAVLLGTGAASFGAGSFATAVTYGTDVSPVSVAIGDLNGDGRPDLALANNGSDDVSVLLGTGAGVFGTAINYGASFSPGSIAIGDLNSDGKLDLAVANNNADTASVLLGTGSGSFGTATSYHDGSSGAVSVAIGDLNGDGAPDLAVANNFISNVSVLLSAATADRSPTALTFGSAGSPVPQGTVSAPQSVTLTNNGSAPLVVSGFAVSGTNPDDFFTSSDTCHASIAVGSSCTVQVRFAPQAQGSRSATLTVLTNAASNPTVSLSGTAGALPQGATGPGGATGAQGPTGQTGATGAQGPAAQNGATGAQGPAGQNGTPGAQGPAGQNGTPGAQGPKGDTGARGPAGRDAKVTCTVKKVRRTIRVRVKCTVVLARSVKHARVQWRLLHSGHVVVHGVSIARRGRIALALSDFARLRRGRYTLSIAGRQHGTTIVIR